MSESTHDWLKKTRLVEEVPGVPPNEQYYLWHNHKVEAHFPTLASGEAYCEANNIVIDEIERVEP